MRYRVLLSQHYEHGGRFPVLYLLHGLYGDYLNWDTRTHLENYARDLRLLIVMPDADDSWYIDSATVPQDKFEDYIAKDLVSDVDDKYRTIRERHGRAIAGLSMGGYGALRFAFARPELFGSVSAQSAALTTESPQELNADLRSAGPFARLLGRAFGNPINVPHWLQNNPFDLARKNQIQIRAQAIYINCGQQDEYGFADGASRMHKQLLTAGVKHEFHLYPGGHSLDYFLSHMGETIEFHWHVFALSAGTR